MVINKNLKIAFNELTDIVKIDRELENHEHTVGIVEPSMRKFLSKSKNVPKEELSKQFPNVPEEKHQEEKKPEITPESKPLNIPEEISPITKKAPTLIARDTIIQGIIHAKGDLEVYGTVIGEIICDHTVVFHGKLKGTIRAEVIMAESGILEGDIFARQIKMKEEAQLIGRLQIGKE